MRLLGIVLLLAAAGCADEPVPTCANGVAHFYEVGCSFEMDMGWPDMAWSINECQQIESTVPKACGAAYDDWITCVGNVGSNQCDSCADEYARLEITDGGPSVGYVFGCD